MTCRSCQNKISLLLDDGLSRRQIEQVRAHMDACPACRSLYDEMRSATQRLNTLDAEPLPTGFESRLHFALQREATPRRKSPAKLLRYTAAATAALVLIAGAVTVAPRLLGQMKADGAEPNAMMMEAAEAPKAKEEAEMLQDYGTKSEKKLAPMATCEQEASDDAASGAFIGSNCSEAHLSVVCTDAEAIKEALDAFEGDMQAKSETAPYQTLSGKRDVHDEATTDDGQMLLHYQVPIEHYDAFVAELRSLCDITDEQTFIADSSEVHEMLLLQIAAQKKTIATLQEEDGDEEDLSVAKAELTRLEDEIMYLEQQENLILVFITIEGQK